MGLHMRGYGAAHEGIRVHDIHSGPKSYKLNLLRKLVVQQ